MSVRYLFGPVTPEFAEHNLRRQRQAGHCLAFDPAGATDLAVTFSDTWESLCSRLPPDWRPDFIALHLPYASVPSCLWSAPVPLVALAPDWDLLLAGGACLAKGDFARARELLDDAASRAPRALPPLVWLSQALLQEGSDWPRAETVLRHVLELDPHNTQARHNLSVLLGRRTVRRPAGAA
jgi:hypothetical protein